MTDASRPTTAAERRMTQSANFFFSPKTVKEVKTTSNHEGKVDAN